MKTVKSVLLLLSACLAISLSAMEEGWLFRGIFTIPRVYDNSCSLGYRKYQTQKLEGAFKVVYEDCSSEPTIEFCYLKNLTHIVGGEPVTYKCSVEDVIWHGIGSNASGVFAERSVSFKLTAEPSYAIGVEPTEDNALILTLSAKGTKSLIQGYAAGQIGCGCAEYGHTSPTRIWGTDTVVDTASTYGRWKAKRASQR